MSWNVIDISRYQGDINFTQVKNSGKCSGVVIRAGIGKYSEGTIQQDSKFLKNIKGFTDVELPIGLYYFSQASTETEAINEAKSVISWAKGYKIQLPIAFDIENEGKIQSLSASQITKNAIAFCTTIKNAGYQTCVYSFKNFLSNRINESVIRQAGFDIWLAHYTTYAHPEYASQYVIWQYSSTGTVPGISGNVDINICYKDYFSGGKNMTQFVPRKSAPSRTDKNWITTAYGGYNHAMKITATGEVIPNCTGYSHGRWLELGLDEAKLSRSNADQYFGHTSDGFKRGSTPKLGAIMCWSCPGKYGHVAVVEEIFSNTSVNASQSNYGGTRYYNKTFNPYTWPSGYVFQGYIYPDIEFNNGTGSPVQRDSTVAQIEVTYEKLRARKSPNGDVINYINPGIYNILSKKDIRTETDGYVWYEVEPSIWIADIGTPDVTILPVESKDYSAKLKIGYASAGDVKSIQSLLDSLTIGYTNPETGYIITTVAPSKGDRVKIEAMCYEKNVPCVEYASDDKARIKELEQQVQMLNEQIKTLNENIAKLTATTEELKIKNSELEGKLDSIRKIVE